MRPRPGVRGHFRLICVPFAGAGPAALRSWTGGLPASADVWIAQLPGRERRIRERPFTQMEPLIEALSESIGPQLDVPFALFGHSMGGLVAFELARALQRQGRIPTGLFVSGSRAPQAPAGRNLHELPDAALIEQIGALNGTPREILDNPDLMKLILPALRADLSIDETYCHVPSPRLECPVFVLGGRADPLVAVESLGEWGANTRGAFKMSSYPGDHFFLFQNDQQAREDLSRTLAQLFGAMD